MKRFRTILCMICAALVAALPAAVSAADSGSRIGVFDMQRIIRESRAGKASRARFEKEVSERRTILADKEKELKAHEERMKEAKGLEPLEMRERERTLSKELRELKRLRVDLEEEIKNMDEELAFTLLKDIYSMVKEIGDREGYDLIVQRDRAMIFVSESADITDKIIAMYDRRAGDDE